MVYYTITKMICKEKLFAVFFQNKSGGTKAPLLRLWRKSAVGGMASMRSIVWNSTKGGHGITAKAVDFFRVVVGADPYR